MNPPPQQILCVAGDPSGDRHLAWLVARLQEQWPQACFFGLGGMEMRAVGVEIVRDSADLSAIGFFSSWQVVPKALRARAALRRRLARLRPALALLVDFGAFNLRFAPELRRQGIPVVYYFPPGSWSTLVRRVEPVAAAANLVLTPFPHSLAAYRAAGAEAHFVGHPLVEHLEPLRQQREARGEGDAVAILPGSRRLEVALMLPLWLETARRLRQVFPKLRCVVSRARVMSERFFQRVWRRAGGEGEVVAGSEPVWEPARLGLVTSGSATLEGALLGIPMVVGYRSSWGNRLIYELFYHPKPTMFAMPNILKGEKILPELAFEQATPQRAAAEAIRLLESERYARVQRELASLREQLWPPDGTVPTWCAAQRLLEWWDRQR